MQTKFANAPNDEQQKNGLRTGRLNETNNIGIWDLRRPVLRPIFFDITDHSDLRSTIALFLLPNAIQLHSATSTSFRRDSFAT